MAGNTSNAFFTVTTPVSGSQTVTITATLGGVSKSATLTVSGGTTPPPPSADTVSIARAEYHSAKRELRVEANSTNAGATLRAYVSSSGALLGTLGNAGGGAFRGQFGGVVNPINITVRSSTGGSASRAVTVR